MGLSWRARANSRASSTFNFPSNLAITRAFSCKQQINTTTTHTTTTYRFVLPMLNIQLPFPVPDTLHVPLKPAHPRITRSILDRSQQTSLLASGDCNLT